MVKGTKANLLLSKLSLIKQGSWVNFQASFGFDLHYNVYLRY